MPNGFFYLHSFDRSISNVRGVWLYFINRPFIESPLLNINSVHPDQTPRFASFLWDARLKWVKTQ